MLKRFHPILAILLSSALVLGCGDDKTAKTPEGDHEDKPLTDQEKQDLKAGIKSYQDALTRIKSYRDTIRKETTEGKPARAHRSLDELSLVLEWLPEFAEKSGVPQAKFIAVTKSADRLRDAFDEVHEKIDAGQKPDYAAVSETIEAEIKTLEGFTPAK